jgi:hypothetical protein
MIRRAKTKTSKSVGIALGFRSGLEEVIGQQIKDTTGLDPEYESFKIEYVKPSKPSKYTPDFRLPNGIIVETKGRFETADRQKHLLIKAQHPELTYASSSATPANASAKEARRSTPTGAARTVSSSPTSASLRAGSPNDTRGQGTTLPASIHQRVLTHPTSGKN